MNTEALLTHLQLPEAKRGMNWEKDFLKFFPSAFVTLTSEQAESGPDNFPYLLVEVKPDSTEPIQKIIEWLETRGIGLVVNPQKGYPDYIFTYGMIVNFKERGEFFTDTKIRTEKDVAFKPEEKVLFGEPSVQYLPTQTRSLIKQFLQEQGILQPRALLAVLNPNTEFEAYDLLFSVESLGKPPENEHQGILQAISWFLPSHYSIAMVSERDLPPFSAI